MSEENQKRIIQILILAISISLSFILAKSIASEFILQVISFLLAIYISTQFLSKKIDFLKQNKLIIDFFIITILIYTLIFSTGDLFSPVFFLIYFLLFGVSLLLEPYSALFLALISSVFFLLQPGKNSGKKLSSFHQFF